MAPQSLSPLLRSRKTLFLVAKITAPVVIFGLLFQRIQEAKGFERLLNEPKDWAFLALAQGLVLLAFSLSYVRWYLLVRGLDLGFHLRDAFRLGTLGFMLNQVSPGSVGGDLLKAVFIAREQPEKRTEAIATVLVDRVIGLYAMLLIASLGLLFAGQTLDSGTVLHFAGQTIDSSTLLRSLRTLVWASALCGTVGLSFVLSPLATGKLARTMADKLPIVGHTVTRLIEAANIYRSRRGYLFAGFGIALLTHCLLITAFWCISHGLPVSGPTFAQNASIVPIGLVVGALPFTPGGLGTMEMGMETLYSMIGAGQGDGTIVAVAYRAMTYVFAGVGAFYYFSSRKKVDELLHDAEALGEDAA